LIPRKKDADLMSIYLDVANISQCASRHFYSSCEFNFKKRII
jgi:hypothetical protein